MDTNRDGQKAAAQPGGEIGATTSSDTSSFGYNFSAQDSQLFPALWSAVRDDPSCEALRKCFRDPRLCVLPTSDGTLTIGPLSVLTDRLMGHDFNPSHALELMPADHYHRFRVDIHEPAAEVARNAKTSKHLWTTLTAEGLSDLLEHHAGSLTADIATIIADMTKRDRACLLPLLCCVLITMADKVRVAARACHLLANTLPALHPGTIRDVRFSDAARRVIAAAGRHVIRPQLLNQAKRIRRQMKQGKRRLLELFHVACRGVAAELRCPAVSGGGSRGRADAVRCSSSALVNATACAPGGGASSHDG